MLNGCFITNQITGSGIDEWMVCVAEGLMKADVAKVRTVFHNSVAARPIVNRLLQADAVPQELHWPLPDFSKFDFVVFQQPQCRQVVDAVRNSGVPTIGVEHFAKPYPRNDSWTFPNHSFLKAMIAVSLKSCVNVPISLRDRIKLIHNGFSWDKAYPENAILQTDRLSLLTELGIDPGDKIISFVGSMTSAKRPVETLLAVDRYNQLCPNSKATLLMCGTGEDLEEVKLTAMQHKILKVRFLEGAYDLRRVYKHTDLFMQLSESEACSFALNEAVASGCRVLTTHTGLVEELTLYRNPPTMWPVISNPHDVDEIASMIHQSLHYSRFSPFYVCLEQQIRLNQKIWINRVEDVIKEVCCG